MKPCGMSFLATRTHTLEDQAPWVSEETPTDYRAKRTEEPVDGILLHGRALRLQRRIVRIDDFSDFVCIKGKSWIVGIERETSTDLQYSMYLHKSTTGNGKRFWCTVDARKFVQKKQQARFSRLPDHKTATSVQNTLVRMFVSDTFRTNFLGGLHDSTGDTP